MKKKKAFDLIHGITGTNIKLGLGRVRRLLELMGNPQDKLEYVHVAGTNGKGSTCTMLSYILQEAGYKVGLNISPFVLDFRERFQINNQMISPEELLEITTYVMSFWEQMEKEGDPPSEFEVVTAIAFEYFYRQKCDIVILEVGMGGRMDATNVIHSPLVSMITSISMDHMSFLGDSIEAIAAEKAGIVKEGGITVVYPKQDINALSVIMETCAKQNNTLIFPTGAAIESSDIFGSTVVIDGISLYIPLAGEHQVWNAAAVVAACRVLKEKGYSLSDEEIKKGIKHTKIPSRVEVLNASPLVILDGAHNASGARALVSTLDTLKGKKVHTVMGIMADKAVDDFLEIIAERCDSLIATALKDTPRFLSPEKLEEKASHYCKEVTAEPDPFKAYQQAKDRCEKEDILLVCGSLHLTSSLRPYIIDDLKDEIV